MSTPQRITTGTNPTAAHRTVYVVRRTMAGKGMARFVAVDRGADGRPRQHATFAAAEAVAKRLGGRTAGLSVFTEFRSPNGMPCAGNYIKTSATPD